MSIIVPSGRTRIGAWVNSKMKGRNPLVYCTKSLIAMQGYRINTNYTGSLGYNSVCFCCFSGVPAWYGGLLSDIIQPPVLSTCPLHTNSGCGKERPI